MSQPSVEQAWLFTCESIAQATPREWGALDERYYRAGLELIIATRAEVESRRAVLRAAHVGCEDAATEVMRQNDSGAALAADAAAGSIEPDRQA